MCGIAGVVGIPLAEGRRFVAKILGEQYHRGPDGEGIWVASGDGELGLVLGHRRFSILGLSEAGDQPMEEFE